jgi:hypothetical protein
MQKLGAQISTFYNALSLDSLSATNDETLFDVLAIEFATCIINHNSITASQTTINLKALSNQIKYPSRQPNKSFATEMSAYCSLV